MGIIVTYGLGGYDPSKPNNNIVEIREVEEDIMSLESQPDVQALAYSLAQLPQETLNALKQALGI